MLSTVGTVSILSTLVDPNFLGGGFTAAPIANWARVVIRNVGPTTLLIGFSPRSVAGQTALGTPGNFVMVANGPDLELYISPRQAVYAASIGDGGRLSFHMSLPPDLSKPELCP